MEHEIQAEYTLRKKSAFVNVLAWIFIIFGGFATFISILQNIMIHVMFPKDFINQEIQQANNAEHVPAFFNIMFNLFDIFFLFFLIVFSISFISAIALLKRKNWARIVFIILMPLGIIWNIGGIAILFKTFNALSGIPGEAMPPEFESMMIIMKIASTIFAIVISVLLLWIIKRLTSAEIKAEFA